MPANPAERQTENPVGEDGPWPESATRYVIEPEAKPSVGVGKALAIEDGVFVDQTEFTLFDYLDADALDTLLRTELRETDEVEVRFTVDDRTVVVRADGTVVVYDD